MNIRKYPNTMRVVILLLAAIIIHLTISALVSFIRWEYYLIYVPELSMIGRFLYLCIMPVPTLILAGFILDSYLRD